MACIVEYEEGRVTISDLDPEVLENFLDMLDDLLQEYGFARCQANCPLRDRVDDIRRLRKKLEK